MCLQTSSKAAQVVWRSKMCIIYRSFLFCFVLMPSFKRNFYYYDFLSPCFMYMPAHYIYVVIIKKTLQLCRGINKQMFKSSLLMKPSSNA